MDRYKRSKDSRCSDAQTARPLAVVSCESAAGSLVGKAPGAFRNAEPSVACTLQEEFLSYALTLQLEEK